MKSIVLILGMVFLAAVPALAGDFAVLKSIYEKSAADYVEELAPEEIALPALKALNLMDKKIRVADDAKRVSLYYGGRFVLGVLKPQNAEADDWARLTVRIIDKAKQISPELDRRDFEIIDTVMPAAFASLAHDNAYYPDLDVSRGKIRRPKLYFSDRMIGTALYIKYGAFNKYTVPNIEKSLSEHPEAEALILDLRGNPGGLLSEAVALAGLFIDEGIIVSTRGRSPDSVKYYTAEAGDIFDGRPMVVLIDAATASSAEVLAAALQEQGRAKLVGTRSYGKGTVQKLISLENRSELALTNAYFYTPSGNKIDKKGLNPDYCTFEAEEDVSPATIIKRGTADCGAENRETRNLDIEVAAELLKDKRR